MHGTDHRASEGEATGHLTVIRGEVAPVVYLLFAHSPASTSRHVLDRPAMCDRSRDATEVEVEVEKRIAVRVLLT